MHEDNCFITLTYNNEHLTPKLQYTDFQKFIKRLRRTLPHEKKISVFVTGEYGEKTKRPHWHAIIFNWRPSDTVHKYTNERGDRVSSSETLDTLWGKGITELGTVTFESAGYCARYAAKKLIHGKDQDHDFHPISKKSSKHAIGKKFLEQYWTDIFNHGEVILPDGNKCAIPRYYEKWLKENQPKAWQDYMLDIKYKRIEKAEAKSDALKEKTYQINEKRFTNGKLTSQISQQEVKKQIIDKKFKQLQTHLKGDI